MGQAPTSHLRMKGCCRSLPLTQRQFWSIRYRSELPFFSACPYLFHYRLTQTLPDAIPTFVLSQPALYNHTACRKLSEYPRGVLVWTSAVMAVRAVLLCHSTSRGQRPRDTCYIHRGVSMKEHRPCRIDFEVKGGWWKTCAPPSQVSQIASNTFHTIRVTTIIAHSAQPQNHPLSLWRSIEHLDRSSRSRQCRPIV
jgi:hypothetical protein